MAAVTTIPTPLGRRVKVVEHGTGTPVVFLHSGVGSAGEWKQVFSLWPEGYRLVAIDAYRDGTGPGAAERRTLDDYADQVYAVAEHVGGPSAWSGSRGAAQPRCAWLLRRPNSWTRSPSSSLRHTRCCARRTPTPTPRSVACAIGGARTFARGGGTRPSRSSSTSTTDPARSLGGRLRAAQAFLALQQTRGDLWDVLFDGLLTLDALAGVTAPVHVVEGSRTSAVDHAICDVVRRHVPHARHTLIEGAGHMMPLTHPEPLTRALMTGIER